MSLMDVNEAAEYLKVTPKAVHRLCKQSRLTYVPMDERGSRRFRKEDLDAYIAANLVPARIPVDKTPRKSVSSPHKGGRKTAGQAAKGLSLKEEITALCQ